MVAKLLGVLIVQVVLVQLVSHLQRGSVQGGSARRGREPTKGIAAAVGNTPRVSVSLRLGLPRRQHHLKCTRSCSQGHTVKKTKQQQRRSQTCRTGLAVAETNLNGGATRARLVLLAQLTHKRREHTFTLHFFKFLTTFFTFVFIFYIFDFSHF